MSAMDRLDDIERAADYLSRHPARRGCRCAGACAECREREGHASKIGSQVVLGLVAEVRRLRAEVEGQRASAKKAETVFAAFTQALKKEIPCGHTVGDRELAAVDERINTAYWAFTRTARGKPPEIVCPDAYARRAELRRLLGRS